VKKLHGLTHGEEPGSLAQVAPYLTGLDPLSFQNKPGSDARQNPCPVRLIEFSS